MNILVVFSSYSHVFYCRQVVRTREICERKPADCSASQPICRAAAATVGSATAAPAHHLRTETSTPVPLATHTRPSASHPVEGTMTPPRQRTSIPPHVITETIHIARRVRRLRLDAIRRWVRLRRMTVATTIAEPLRHLLVANSLIRGIND